MAYKSVKRSHTIADLISNAYGEWQSLRDEMQEWRDNLEEKLSSTQKYQDVSDAVDALEQFCDEEPEFPLNDSLVSITWNEVVNKSKKRSPSRAVRCQNACAMIDAAISGIEGHINELAEGDELKDTLEQLVEELTGHKDEAEAVDFPGMY